MVHDPKQLDGSLVMDNVMKDIQRLKQVSKQKLLQETLDIKEIHLTIKNDLHAKEAVVSHIYKVLKKNQEFLQGMKQFRKGVNNDARTSLFVSLATAAKKPV